MTDERDYTPRWVGAAQACAMLGGMDMKRLMGLAREGVIRFTKPGRSYLFRVADIDDLDERIAYVRSNGRAGRGGRGRR